MANLNKKIRRQIASMPKYQIQDEVFENQNMARARAFGRDRSIQMQEENLEQDAANAAAEAKDVTGSTNSLLATISAINANTSNARRGLAQDEAQLANARANELMTVNQMVVDEKDKAWRQNVFAPWDAKLRDLQRRKANKDRIISDVGNGFMGALQSFLGRGGGGATSGGGRGGFDNGSGSATGGGQALQ